MYPRTNDAILYLGLLRFDDRPDKIVTYYIGLESLDDLPDWRMPYNVEKRAGTIREWHFSSRKVVL